MMVQVVRRSLATDNIWGVVIAALIMWTMLAMFINEVMQIRYNGAQPRAARTPTMTGNSSDAAAGSSSATKWTSTL